MDIYFFNVEAVDDAKIRPKPALKRQEKKIKIIVMIIISG